MANAASELARISDTMKENSSTPATVTAQVVVSAMLALDNYKYPAAKNPYGGVATPYFNGSASGDGNVGVVPQASYSDPATGKTFPAVVLSATFKGPNGTSTITKVVALD